MKYLRETPLAYHPRPRQESLRTLDNLQSTSPGSTTSPASRDVHSHLHLHQHHHRGGMNSEVKYPLSTTDKPNR
jgi:hypothetical protein